MADMNNAEMATEGIEEGRILTCCNTKNISNINESPTKKLKLEDQLIVALPNDTKTQATYINDAESIKIDNVSMGSITENIIFSIPKSKDKTKMLEEQLIAALPEVNGAQMAEVNDAYMGTENITAGNIITCSDIENSISNIATSVKKTLKKLEEPLIDALPEVNGAQIAEVNDADMDTENITTGNIITCSDIENSISKIATSPVKKKLKKLEEPLIDALPEVNGAQIAEVNDADMDTENITAGNIITCSDIENSISKIATSPVKKKLKKLEEPLIDTLPEVNGAQIAEVNDADIGTGNITAGNIITCSDIENSISKIATSPVKKKLKKLEEQYTSTLLEDMNARLMEPLIYGFKREVVYRAIKSKTTNCDIYYRTPNFGPKLRSVNDMAKYLEVTGSSFTLSNFTFQRHVLGFGEPYEIVRSANSVPGRIKVETRGSSDNPTTTTKINLKSLKNKERKCESLKVKFKKIKVPEIDYDSVKETRFKVKYEYCQASESSDNAITKAKVDQSGVSKAVPKFKHSSLFKSKKKMAFKVKQKKHTLLKANSGEYTVFKAKPKEDKKSQDNDVFQVANKVHDAVGRVAPIPMLKIKLLKCATEKGKLLSPPMNDVKAPCHNNFGSVVRNLEKKCMKQRTMDKLPDCNVTVIRVADLCSPKNKTVLCKVADNNMFIKETTIIKIPEIMGFDGSDNIMVENLDQTTNGRNNVTVTETVLSHLQNKNDKLAINSVPVTKTVLSHLQNKNDKLSINTVPVTKTVLSHLQNKNDKLASNPGKILDNKIFITADNPAIKTLNDIAINRPLETTNVIDSVPVTKTVLSHLQNKNDKLAINSVLVTKTVLSHLQNKNDKLAINSVPVTKTVLSHLQNKNDKLAINSVPVTKTVSSHLQNKNDKLASNPGKILDNKIFITADNSAIKTLNDIVINRPLETANVTVTKTVLSHLQNWNEKLASNPGKILDNKIFIMADDPGVKASHNRLINKPFQTINITNSVPVTETIMRHLQNDNENSTTNHELKPRIKVRPFEQLCDKEVVKPHSDVVNKKPWLMVLQNWAKYSKLKPLPKANLPTTLYRKLKKSPSSKSSVISFNTTVTNAIQNPVVVPLVTSAFTNSQEQQTAVNPLVVPLVTSTFTNSQEQQTTVNPLVVPLVTSTFTNFQEQQTTVNKSAPGFIPREASSLLLGSVSTQMTSSPHGLIPIPTTSVGPIQTTSTHHGPIYTRVGSVHNSIPTLATIPAPVISAVSYSIPTPKTSVSPIQTTSTHHGPIYTRVGSVHNSIPTLATIPAPVISAVSYSIPTPKTSLPLHGVSAHPGPIGRQAAFLSDSAHSALSTHVSSVIPGSISTLASSEPNCYFFSATRQNMSTVNRIAPHLNPVPQKPKSQQDPIVTAMDHSGNTTPKTQLNSSDKRVHSFTDSINSVLKIPLSCIPITDAQNHPLVALVNPVIVSINGAQKNHRSDSSLSSVTSAESVPTKMLTGKSLVDSMHSVAVQNCSPILPSSLPLQTQNHLSIVSFNCIGPGAPFSGLTTNSFLAKPSNFSSEDPLSIDTLEINPQLTVTYPNLPLNVPVDKGMKEQFEKCGITITKKRKERVPAVSCATTALPLIVPSQSSIAPAHILHSLSTQSVTLAPESATASLSSTEKMADCQILRGLLQYSPVQNPHANLIPGFIFPTAVDLPVSQSTAVNSYMPLLESANGQNTFVKEVSNLYPKLSITSVESRKGSPTSKKISKYPSSINTLSLPKSCKEAENSKNIVENTFLPLSSPLVNDCKVISHSDEVEGAVKIYPDDYILSTSHLHGSDLDSDDEFSPIIKDVYSLNELYTTKELPQHIDSPVTEGNEVQIIKDNYSLKDIYYPKEPHIEPSQDVDSNALDEGNECQFICSLNKPKTHAVARKSTAGPKRSAIHLWKPISKAVAKESTAPRKMDVAKESTAPRKVDVAKESTAPRKMDVAKESTAPRKVDVAKESTAPRKMDVAKESTTPRKVDGAKESTSPIKVVIAKESAAPIKVVVAKESTAPRKVDVAKESTAPRKVAVARKSTAPRKVDAAKQSTAPIKVVVAKESAAPIKIVVAKESTAPMKFAVAKESTAPIKVVVAKESTAPRKVAVARKSTAPRKVAVARKSTAPRKVDAAKQSTAPRNFPFSLWGQPSPTGEPSVSSSDIDKVFNFNGSTVPGGVAEQLKNSFKQGGLYVFKLNKSCLIEFPYHLLSEEFFALIEIKTTGEGLLHAVRSKIGGGKDFQKASGTVTILGSSVQISDFKLDSTCNRSLARYPWRL